MKKLFVLSIALLSLVNFSHATHVVGGDISYKHISDSIFEFYITYYRDCGGVPFGNPSSASSIECLDGSNNVSLSLTLVSIKDITTLCPGQAAPCDPANTRLPGVKGYEEHVYSVKVDFSKAPYNNLKCSDVRVQSGQCCRQGSVTTGPNGNFYMSLTLNIDRAQSSTSPTFVGYPDQTLCCNSPAYVEFGSTDVDGDSISYSLIDPRTSKTTSTTYSSGFSAQQPFSPYYINAKKETNPYSNPPAGFYFDSIKGHAIFTPVDCNEITIVNVETKEWRKDSSKVYQLVSTSHRELQFTVISCSGNNAPTIQANSEYTICDGEQLCFNITTDDKRLIPPPPMPAPPQDSVSISWNRGIPGASFTVLNPTDTFQTGRFCWTPNLNNTQVETLQFTVKARDNSCPTPGNSHKVISIKVLPAAVLDLGPDTTIGKPFNLTLNIGDSIGTYIWSTGDSTKSISVNDWGTYWVEMRNECDTLRDSIMVTQSLSIADFESSQFRLYPNPSAGNFQIISSKKIVQPVKVIDLLGQEIGILEQGDDFKRKIQLPDFSAGVYHVIVTNSDGQFVSKIVVLEK